MRLPTSALCGAVLLVIAVAAVRPLSNPPPRAALSAAADPQYISAASTVASDPFGMAHISAVNSQQPTYSALRYQQAASAGAAWNRWVFYWHEIEQANGYSDYTPQDDTVNQDVANGFRYKIDALLMGTPSWATDAGTAAGEFAPAPRVGGQSLAKLPHLSAVGYTSGSPVTRPPNNLNLGVFADNTDYPAAGKAINQNNYWARFVYNTVNRYKDRVRHWEIWNEPDFTPTAASGWYGFWSGTADEYFRLLKVAYLAAKHADPSAVVVMGGMAYWPEIVYEGTPPFDFFRRVLVRATTDVMGPANGYFFDATAWHWYNRSSQSYYKVRDTQAVLGSYGLGTKPIWNNETGLPAWNDPLKPPPGGNSPYFGSGTMTEQASYILQSLAYGLAAGVERSFAFQEYDDGNGEAFGYVRNNGTPRPSYYAYQIAAQYLTGDYSATLVEHGAVSIVTAYTSAGNRVVVVWNNSPTTTQVLVQAQAGSALLVGQPTEANPAGTSQTIYPAGGRYAITLPGATDNNGVSSSDYIVGGLVSLVIETAQPGPTPTPTSTPIASPSGLIVNGSFDLQPSFAGWQLSGYLPALLLTGPDGGKYAVLGANYAEQPGLMGANSTISQSINLSGDATNLALRFSYLLNTSQPSPTNFGDPFSYDKFEVILFDQAGTRHDLLVDWTGKFWWTEATLDLTAYRSQTVTLVLNVWQSQATNNYPTTAYVDNVRLWPHAASLPGVLKNSGSSSPSGIGN